MVLHARVAQALHMTDQWNSRSGVHDAPTPDAGPDSSGRNRGWDGGRWRRPRRSTGDRKIAGVAGGLGRAFGVDPILLRVGFVVLTIFGGFGGLLYVLGWLLLPADGDEVSAAGALLGRGRSSVPPPLAVGLGVVAVISAFSMFSWGLPFLPLAIGGLIVLSVLRKRGHHQPGAGGNHGQWHGRNHQRNAGWADHRRADWTERTDARVRAVTEQAQRWAEQAQHWGDQAGRWGDQAQRWGRSHRQFGGDRWSCGSRWDQDDRVAADERPAGSSPFPQPPFWEQPSGTTSRPPAADSAGPVNMTKQTGPAAPDTGTAAGWPGPDGEPRTTPPAWDPLGVAPFAWDLPEPTPLPDPSARPQRRTVLPQVTLGATLLVGAALAGGVFAGWWGLTWAQVSGLTLAVLAIGLLFSALRGGGRSLIGGGVFLSLVTLALAVTGLSGTTGYGAAHITPGSFAELQSSYSANAGDLDLDFSGITVPKGTVKTVDVELKAGHAQVTVPSGANVVAVCASDVGQTNCLGETSDGVRTQSSRTLTGHADSGTLELNVTVKAGLAEVVARG